MFTGSFVVYFLLILTCAVVMMAVRSVWQLRFESPFTPTRLGLMLLIAGAAWIVGALNGGPAVALTLTGGVLCASLGWLVYSESFRKRH